VALVRPERRLENIIRVHAHLVIPTVEVDLGEEPSAPQLIQELVDDWDGELVFDGCVVEGTVVDTKPLAVVMLADQEHQQPTPG